jgi:peptidoglycan/xylan/chitin deacetylase (PgdA/CDA1 family)
MEKLLFNRRETLRALGYGIAGMITLPVFSCKTGKKRHIVTLSFDDGFEKSSIKTAELYEKYGLSACINVIATAHLQQFNLPNEYHAWRVGDFTLWNELKARGHEIMPHTYRHQNLAETPFEEAKELILKCLDMFTRELSGFVARESIYNFAYNASTPELEEWLTTQVRAFRTGGPAINPLPFAGQTRLTCTSYGPDSCDKHLGETIDNFLKGPSGWLIYNTHGLDDEGWGPMSSTFLDELLDRLVHTDTAEVLPAGVALSSIT